MGARVLVLYNEPVLPTNGRIALSDRPGLGVTLNEAVVAKLRVEA